MILFVSQLWAQPQTTSYPECSFQMGSGRSYDESPKHLVVLTPYRIDKHEVSIADFEKFVKQGWNTDSYWSAEGLSWRTQNPSGAGKENRAAGRFETHPVVAVSWYEADAYCKWKGGHLPSEAQWEQASCPKEGRFPWGDDENIEAVWYSGGKYGHLQSVLTKPVKETSPGQKTEAGLTHTVGNVWEWTADWYHQDSYKNHSETNPSGPADGLWKTMRGGSFMNLPSYCSCTHREPAKPDRVAYTVGFRCAYSEPKP